MEAFCFPLMAFVSACARKDGLRLSDVGAAI